VIIWPGQCKKQYNCDWGLSCTLDGHRPQLQTGGRSSHGSITGIPPGTPKARHRAAHRKTKDVARQNQDCTRHRPVCKWSRRVTPKSCMCQNNSHPGLTASLLYMWRQHTLVKLIAHSQQPLLPPIGRDVEKLPHCKNEF
jgi:hypothetical protein